MNSILLSVIIPIYNGEQWIRRAVESISVQPEFSRIEVILVNDGSSDNSSKVCDSLCNKERNIFVYHKENGGVSSARNLGIQLARGKYVCFLDCDDWWDPHFFTQDIVYTLSSSKSADIYQFAYKEVNTFISLEKLYSVKDKEIIYDTPALGRYDWAPHCSFILSRQLLIDNNLKYPNAKSFEDGSFVEMVFYCASSYCSINKVIFNYWENPSSRVHTSTILDSLQEHYKAVQQEERFFESKGVIFRGDISWHIVNALPKLCAEEKLITLIPFVKKYCLDVLDQHPEERYRNKLWTRVNKWRKSPAQCYFFLYITSGVWWKLKNRLLRFSATYPWINYLYSRYYRRFLPINLHKM